MHAIAIALTYARTHARTYAFHSLPLHQQRKRKAQVSEPAELERLRQAQERLFREARERREAAAAASAAASATTSAATATATATGM